MTDEPKRSDEREGLDAPNLDETQPTSRWAWLANGIGTAADRRNQALFLAWTFAWMLSFTLAAQTLKGNLSGLGLEVEGSAVWVVAVLPNVLAVGTLLAYLRFLRMTDELARLIQLQGLAVGFGALFFLSMCWELLEAAGAPPLGDAQLVVPLFAMGLGTLFLSWRYR